MRGIWLSRRGSLGGVSCLVSPLTARTKSSSEASESSSMGDTVPAWGLRDGVSGGGTRNAACTCLHSRCAPGCDVGRAGRGNGLNSQRLCHFESSSTAANGGGRGVVVGIAVVGAVDRGRVSGSKDSLIAKLLEAAWVARRRF